MRKSNDEANTAVIDSVESLGEFCARADCTAEKLSKFKMNYIKDTVVRVKVVLGDLNARLKDKADGVPAKTIQP